jgi:hypothetical protein
MATKLSLVSSCPICNSNDKLRRCLGCKVVAYCCQDHQVSDWNAHKRVCKSIKKTQEVLDLEEQRLRALPPDTANALKVGLGPFWKVLEPRQSMKLRFGLVNLILKVKTPDAVNAALQHLMDMLRLCRTDGAGARNLVPSLFLRLGKDQECYDFVKWWHTTGQDSHYDWEDMSLPFLDVKDADVFEDVFEPVVVFTEKCLALSHTVSVTLLKVRLLLDVRALQSSIGMSEKLPQEALDNNPSQFVSTIVAKNKDIMESKDQSALIEKLESQVKELYMAVKRANNYFWSALLQPGAHLVAHPIAYDAGSLEEMQLALQDNYDSWVETPGAIDVVRGLVKKDNSK